MNLTEGVGDWSRERDCSLVPEGGPVQRLKMAGAILLFSIYAKLVLRLAHICRSDCDPIRKNPHCTHAQDSGTCCIKIYIIKSS